MSIQTITGDLLQAQEGFIIHGCNMQGVMGSGVARGVKALFPGAFEVYAEAHQEGRLKLGHNTYFRATPSLWIVNAVTQNLYGKSGGVFVDYAALRACFVRAEAFIRLVEEHEGYKDIGSLPILFPKIGAGRAGGDWEQISSIINEAMPSREKILYVPDEEPAYCR